jgi:hypothetical protein
MALRSAGGQLPAAAGPAIPASGSWLAAHLAGPVTVPGTRGGGSWRVVLKAVRYQAQRMPFVPGPDDLRYVIGGRTGHGSRGMLIVMAQLAGTGQAASGYTAGSVRGGRAEQLGIGVLRRGSCGALVIQSRAIGKPGLCVQDHEYEDY